MHAGGNTGYNTYLYHDQAGGERGSQLLANPREDELNGSSRQEVTKNIHFAFSPSFRHFILDSLACFTNLAKYQEVSLAHVISNVISTDKS